MTSCPSSIAEWPVWLHEGHQCEPGPCECKCGCFSRLVCKKLAGQLCSKCLLSFYRDDDDVHGPAETPEKGSV
jgi:hypothetical protein